MTDSKSDRFDKLLHAMATKPPLETPAKGHRTSNAAASGDCDDTQPPKDKSEDAS